MLHTNMDHLFQRYYEKTASEAEIAELMRWMSDPANEAALTRLMQERWEAMEPGALWLAPEKGAAMLDRILPAAPAENPSKGRVFRLWPRVAAAAVIVLLLSAGGYMLLHRTAAPVAVAPAAAPVKNDVMPGGNRATLVLANGSTIVLDSAGRGLLAQQGGTSVTKLQDGELLYNAAGEDHPSAGLNTISTPRGGQYQVVLPDGSRVWLNAASSLRFPTAFTGRERNVELTGEAYFEIEKNREKPFHVLVNGLQVEVLGTHFDVMAYDDEAQIKTSLLEGKVKLSREPGAGSRESKADSRVTGKEQQTVMLLPGQQASLDRAERQLKIDKNADIDKAVAWKNGLFDFEGDDIQDIMRQLSRWYDIKAVYPGAVPAQHYTGYIRRQVPVSEVLHMLELAGGVSFEIKNDMITVKSR